MSSTANPERSRGESDLPQPKLAFWWRLNLYGRATIHPILVRLGIEMLSTRIIHLRDDDRFKAVGPDNFVQPYPVSHAPGASKAQEEGEIWFDWAFVDFWKSNYCMYSSALVMFMSILNLVTRNRHCAERSSSRPEFTVFGSRCVPACMKFGRLFTCKFYFIRTKF